MPRAKNAVASRARRKKVLKQTRGNFGARKNVWTIAKNTYEKGLTYAFRDRRKKKSEFRALWINRKVLADLAMNHPEAFKAIVAKVKELAK